MRPGYEYTVAQRPAGYETNDDLATVTPAETRAGTMAQRRAAWQGRGQSGRGRAAMPQRPVAQVDDAELQAMKLRMRMLELEQIRV